MSSSMSSAGSAAAWWVTRALAGLFLGVSPHDPAAFLGAAGLFTGVALIAASVPAFRTTHYISSIIRTMTRLIPLTTILSWMLRSTVVLLILSSEEHGKYWDLIVR